MFIASNCVYGQIMGLYAVSISGSFPGALCGSCFRHAFRFFPGSVSRFLVSAFHGSRFRHYVNMVGAAPLSGMSDGRHWWGGQFLPSDPRISAVGRIPADCSLILHTYTCEMSGSLIDAYAHDA